MYRVYQNLHDRLTVGFLSLTSASVLSVAICPKSHAQVFYHVDRGAEVLTSNDEANLEIIALYDVGLRYYQQGRYDRALKTFQDYLTAVRGLGKNRRLHEAVALTQIGRIYESLGRYNLALNSFQNALHVKGTGVIYDYIGFAYFRLGKIDEALDALEKALEIHQAVNARADEGITWGHLGAVYLKQGNYDRAIDYYQRALELHLEVEDTIGEGIALDGLGQAYLRLGDTEKAREQFAQALDVLQKDNIPSYAGIALGHLGEALLESGDLVTAETKLREAINIFESLREGLSDLDKVAIFDTQASAYRLLQRVLVAQGKFEEALEISERGRARAFVELLAWRLGERSQTPFAPPIPPTSAEIRQVSAEQNATLVEYSVVGDRLYIWVVRPTGEIDFREVNPEDILGGTPEEMTIASLVERTRDDLEWASDEEFVAENSPVSESESSSNNFDGLAGELATGLLPKNPISRSNQNANEDPRAGVEVVGGTNSSSTSNNSNSRQNLQQLHQILIEPIADLLPTNPDDRVIFLPQNELFLVPFPALANADGQYLIQHHTILTAPAIQVLQLTQQAQTENEGANGNLPSQEILVVGNPTMPSIPVYLSPLPGSEVEAKNIARQFNTLPLTGNAATETEVKRRMQTARIVHLATHGLLEYGSANDDRGRDLPGAIVLAATPENDGLLTSSELLEMDLNAELVVLSACNTGQGKITGDGVLGLSRSLIVAGAPNIVVSLWSVPDDSTSNLMVEFYRQWEQIPDKAQAMRQAMLTTMAQHPHPIDWAGFTIMGVN